LSLLRLPFRHSGKVVKKRMSICHPEAAGAGSREATERRRTPKDLKLR